MGLFHGNLVSGMGLVVRWCPSLSTLSNRRGAPPCDHRCTWDHLLVFFFPDHLGPSSPAVKLHHFWRENTPNFDGIDQWDTQPEMPRPATAKIWKKVPQPGTRSIRKLQNCPKPQKVEDFFSSYAILEPACVVALLALLAPQTAYNSSHGKDTWYFNTVNTEESLCHNTCYIDMVILVSISTR